MLSLTVEKGEPAGAVFELKAGESTLGRSRSATCRLLTPDVSGLHARIRVENGAARLENLSQFGTRVDGAPVTEAVTLRSGQRIGIGKVTVLQFRQDDTPGLARAAPATFAAAAHPPAELEADTGESPRPPPGATRAAAPTVAATRAAADAAATRADNAADDLSELTSALSPPSWEGEEGATEGATRAMQTRAATPEEIEHLKLNEQKRARRRMTVGLSVGIPLVVLALIFRPRTPPPEKEIEWTKDAAGDYVYAFAPGPAGGDQDGGYDVCYPGNETFKKRPLEGGLMLEGWIARNLDVPMRVLVQEQQEVRLTALSREDMVEDWMLQASGSGGHWNFDKPSPTLAFLGRKNGIPYTRVTYLRDADGASWFGVACVLRHGSRRIVARTEVPAAERVRAEKMMSVKLIRPSDEFEFSYWEGAPVGTKLVYDEVLVQARADLERMAPATWVAIETLLKNVLTQAVLEGRAEIEREAVRLLVRLRERQALWFNSQQLAFDAAIMQNNWRKAANVAEFTKAVFSNVEDQRYFSVRKWRAEP